jgi:acyl-CoA oxidase
MKRHPTRFISIIEMLPWVDHSLAVKTSVNFGLFGASLILLGTERHLQYIEAIDSLKMPGCFALTEVWIVFVLLREARFVRRLIWALCYFC